MSCTTRHSRSCKGPLSRGAAVPPTDKSRRTQSLRCSAPSAGTAAKRASAPCRQFARRAPGFHPRRLIHSPICRVVVLAELLDVLCDETRTLQRELHTRELYGVAVGKHVALGEVSVVADIGVQVGDAMVEQTPVVARAGS